MTLMMDEKQIPCVARCDRGGDSKEGMGRDVIAPTRANGGKQ
jgi:hypothetical protein